jgi:hypothetical protein
MGTKNLPEKERDVRCIEHPTSAKVNLGAPWTTQVYLDSDKTSDYAGSEPWRLRPRNVDFLYSRIRRNGIGNSSTHPRNRTPRSRVRNNYDQGCRLKWRHEITKSWRYHANFGISQTCPWQLECNIMHTRHFRVADSNAGNPWIGRGPLIF